MADARDRRFEGRFVHAPRVNSNIMGAVERNSHFRQNHQGQRNDTTPFPADHLLPAPARGPVDVTVPVSAAHGASSAKNVKMEKKIPILMSMR